MELSPIEFCNPKMKAIIDAMSPAELRSEISDLDDSMRFLLSSKQLDSVANDPIWINHFWKATVRDVQGVLRRFKIETSDVNPTNKLKILRFTAVHFDCITIGNKEMFESLHRQETLVCEDMRFTMYSHIQYAMDFMKMCA